METSTITNPITKAPINVTNKDHIVTFAANRSERALRIEWESEHSFH